MNILECDSVQLAFSGRKILSDVYIRCVTGEVCGLLGRNGEGKSCLMKILVGSLSADEGIVRLNGEFLKPIHRMSFVKYLPQFHFIPASLKVQEVLKDFELSAALFVDRFPEFKEYFKCNMLQLSGGMRRTLELYIIIKSKANFIFLDEPFTHLYPLQIEKILDLIREEKHIKSFLISDHMYQHILDISDQIYLLRQGKLHMVNHLEEIEDLGYAHL